MGQQGILSVRLDSDKETIEKLIGWESVRQVTWASLTIPCLVGIFCLIRFMKGYSSSYARFLFTLMYLGFVLSFEYCILKLLWSHQLLTRYDAILNMRTGVADPIQNLLFSHSGAMSSEGAVIITILLGLTAALLFQIPQLNAYSEVEATREKELVGKARLLIEEKPDKENEAATTDFTEVKGIGPKMAGKLKEAGFENLRSLANSSPKEIAQVLNISDSRAANLIKKVRSVLGEDSRK